MAYVRTGHRVFIATTRQIKNVPHSVTNDLSGSSRRHLHNEPRHGNQSPYISPVPRALRTILHIRCDFVWRKWVAVGVSLVGGCWVGKSSFIKACEASVPRLGGFKEEGGVGYSISQAPPDVRCIMAGKSWDPALRHLRAHELEH